MIHITPLMIMAYVVAVTDSAHANVSNLNMHRLYACLNLQVFAAAPCPPCHLVPPCPPAAPQLRVAMFLQGIRCACGCRPSCCLFGVDVVVGHRAVLFIAGFGSFPMQGRCCQNLDLTLLRSFYCRRGYCNILNSSLCRTAR